MLSKRAERGLARCFKSEGLNKLYAEDPFDPDKNCNGFIKLCSADNILSRDLLKAELSDDVFKSFDRSQLSFYPTPGGEPPTKRVVSDFINKHCVPGLKQAVTPDSIVLVPGVTAASDLLSQALFDEDDVLLTFAPYYYRFPNDFGDRGLIQIEHVDSYFPETNSFELRIDLLEAKLQQLKNAGKQVKAVLLVNPRNPDGGFFTKEEIRPVIEWTVKKHGLFLILDEIYNKTVFEDAGQYSSGLSVVDEEDSSLDRNKVVWMWGLSKIFSVPGLRVAAIHTTNGRVLESVERSLMYQGLSFLTQHVVNKFLSNDEFVSRFFKTNQQLLRQSRDHCLQLFEKHSGDKRIRVMPSKAAFFVMVNFGEYMKSNTFEGESALQERFKQHKVLIVPGQSLSMAEPGWFRVVFSASDPHEMELGIKRMFEALNN